MEPQTLASLVADAIETQMSAMSAFNSPLSLQGMTTSESEDDPMGMEEDTSKKKTKPMYYARRDETRKLKAELSALTERMEQIQQIKQQNDDALMENAQLRDGLKQTDMTLAGIQSILADYRAAHARNPLDVKINLSTESVQRHQTLAALRDERLRVATDFALERVRFLGWRLPHRENASFELSNGDHVLLQCEVEPCRTDGTVK